MNEKSLIDQLPPDLRNEIARAQAACARYAERFERSLRERVGAEALAGAQSGRFAESLDILAGKKKPQLGGLTRAPEQRFARAKRAGADIRVVTGGHALTLGAGGFAVTRRAADSGACRACG